MTRRPPRRERTLAGKPHGPDAVFGRERDQGAEQPWMLMEMLMAVHMIGRKAGLAKELELRPDLGQRLAPYVGKKGDLRPGLDDVATEPASVFVDEIREFLLAQRRGRVQERNMESDTELGHATRAGDRVGGGIARHHQARRGEHAAAMGFLDGLVDRDRHAEVIAGDDELAVAHTAGSRSAGGRPAALKWSARIRAPRGRA